MSKEAEEFFKQKTIENAKRPRMKKFLALVNRETEGGIMQEYADQQLRLYVVSQRSELLKSFADWLQGEVWDDKHDDFSDYVEDYIKTL